MELLSQNSQSYTINESLILLKDHDRLVERAADPDLIPPPTQIIENLKDKIDGIYGLRGALEHNADAIDVRI